MASRRSMICCETTKAVRQPTLWMFGHDGCSGTDAYRSPALTRFPNQGVSVECFIVSYICIMYIPTFFLSFWGFFPSCEVVQQGNPFSSILARQFCAFSSRVMGVVHHGFSGGPFQREKGLAGRDRRNGDRIYLDAESRCQWDMGFVELVVFAHWELEHGCDYVVLKGGRRSTSKT